MVAYTLASSSEDGLKTWTYGAPPPPPSSSSSGSSSSSSPGSSSFGSSATPAVSVLAPRSQLRGGTGGAAQCARFNHNGQVLVGAGAAGVITLWHTNGTVLGELARDKDRGHPIRALYFSSGSRYLATGGADRVVKIWDLKRREVIRSFKAHTTAVSCVQFSKDADKFVASGAASGKVCLFNVLSGRLVNTLAVPVFPSSSGATGVGVRAVSFSPFRKSILAAAYDDGCVRTWDVSVAANSSSSSSSTSTGSSGSKQQSLLHTFSGGHADASRISAVSYSPIDPNTLMSAGHDKTIRLYDTKLASMVGTLEADTALSCACFFPDGRRIVAGTVRGELLVFDARRMGSSVHPVARVTAHGRSVVTSVQVQPGGGGGGSGGGGGGGGGKSRANKSNSTGRAVAAAGTGQVASVLRSSASSSARSIVDPSIASMRSSQSSAVSVVSVSSDVTRGSHRSGSGSGSSSTASSISRLPQSVSVFSAVKKPQTRGALQSPPMVKPVKMEVSSEIPSVRREKAASGEGKVIASGEGSTKESTGGGVSAVTASTMSLEEQIRNLLGDPSKATVAVAPKSAAARASTSSAFVASKESGETKQESIAPRAPAANKVSVMETPSTSDISDSRSQVIAPSSARQDDLAPLSGSVSTSVLQQVVEDSMVDMCADLRGDIQNVHVELLRQFQVQIVSVLSLSSFWFGCFPLFYLLFLYWLRFLLQKQAFQTYMMCTHILDIAPTIRAPSNALPYAFPLFSLTDGSSRFA